MSWRFDDKGAARQAVWDRLADERLARFPFPPHGRIPNFKGAEAAARRLLALAPWKDAGRIKINPDAPQRPVRIEALRRGITVYMPTPRLRGGFKKLDPAKIPPEAFAAAASLSRGERWAEEVPLEAMPAMDAIVAGSVAVTAGGRRAGKGEGYSDLEFAILRELGHPAVPVATTVHEVQVVDALPWEETDIPLAAVATPERAIVVDEPPPAPAGVDWDRLTDEDLDEMPVLRELRQRRARMRA